MRIQWADLKIFDNIGSGSFGRVFHGDLLGTEVAIKECVRSNSREFDEKYFKREVDILRQSRHPNIVQFMGICKRKKRFYIVTEFLPLGNLRRWIQDETKEFGWDTRISFAIDISLALAYLHHKNIIHRDLKGENLLISENMRIKVCDFGFSRVAARDDDEMRRISYCGTDGYMAPEILLGEDFDTSVDVFSFGVVLAEMMARHVVDPQHFQRLAPDFRVSTDEILFRAQPGCPVELGELAIHCVHPLPQHRPKLREVVERLTAIENVDIHVGTTLVVAPSVARAARNMAMKQQAEAKKQQDKQPLYLHGNVGLYPGGMQPENGYPTTSSSIRGVAESSRMTRMTDASSNPSSRMTSSDFVGSQSTFRGRPWKQQGGSRELEFQVGSSVIPLVLGERLREREPSEMYETSTVSMRSSEGSEDEHAFRMPRWDSINSPDNLEQLRQWHQSNPAGGSVMDEEEVLRSWDQERHHQRGESRPNLSQLSSIQLELNEHDDDGEYSCSLDSDDGSSDEELDSLFDESSDYGSESRIYGQMGGTGTYQLSSDSDASLSSSSLTESVVRALDTLEIPDLQMASLPGLPRDSSAMTPDLDLEMVGIREAMDAALGSSVYPQDDDGENTKVFRKPQLISRLLPPIPLSENPWTSFQSPQANTGLATERKEDGVVVVDHHHPPQNDASGTAPVLHAINVLRTETLTIGTTAVEAKEISEAAAEASDTPPEPPSKSSLLLRSYSLKSNPSPPTTINVASPPTDKEPTPTAPEETPCTTTLTAVDSAPTSTASSETSASSVSSASSTGEPVVKTEEDGQTNAAENTTNGTTPHPPPRGPLVRGMSDSLLESTSASNTVESGYTITGNIIAAMGARTWTSGTGGFGHWISQYTQGDPAADKTGLKKHTSLKEGKQQRLLVNELSNLHGLEESEDTTADRMLVSEPLPSVKEDGPGVEPIPTVKRRAPKPLTGFPHRFSLVVFSTQLLPKCDVCLKRLGVLPGWSAKHLECDDCGYRTHPKCAPNVTKCCTSARKSGIWDIPV